MKRKFQTFFYGRYGNDQLGMFLFVCSLVFYFISLLFDLEILGIVGVVLMTFSTFRIYSKNISQRQGENQRYLRYSAPYLKKLNLLVMSWKDQSHRYFSCPHCGKILRVPKGKGTISVHCSGCQGTFREKS